MYRFPLKVFPSHLNTAAQCLFKFSCQHDSEAKAKFVESPDSFVGKVMHLALKTFFNLRQLPMHERAPERMNVLVREAWPRVPRSGNKGFWSPDERRQLFGSAEQERALGLQCIEVLRNYLTKADLSVMPLVLEEWLSCELEGIALGGRPDRIDKNGDRGIAVWDYKTGKLPFSDPTEMVGDYNDYQLPVYAVIASHLFPFAETIRVGQIYLKSCKVYQRSWTREQLKEVESDLLAFINRLREEEEFPPKINGLCPWCEYRKICPAQDLITDKMMRMQAVAW